MTQKKESPAGAGQDGMTGSINSGKVTDFQQNNQTFFDGIFESTKSSANMIPLDYREICSSNKDPLTRLYTVLNYAENGGVIDELAIHGLPPHLQAYISHVADVYQCPREFPTVALFSAISTAAGTKVSIAGKHDNSLCLWFVDVSPTGGSKSQPTKEVLRPIYRINTELKQKYSEALKAAAKDDDPPKLERIVFKDATREARAVRMRDFPHGTLLHRDEFSGLFKDFARYSANGGEREELLSIFDNNDPIQVDRKGSEPVDVERPFMNILGGIQPDILTESFGDADVASGLFGRFLFAWPDEPLYPDYKDSVIGDDFRQHWQDVVNYIYREMKPITLVMPPQTTQLYSDYFNFLQNRKRSLSEGDQEGVIYSKAQIQVIRLAGIVHTAKLAYDHDAGCAIGADTMGYAVECMEYFVRCGERALHRVCNAQRKSNKTETLRRLIELYPNVNLTQLASAIKVEQPWLSAIKNGRK